MYSVAWNSSHPLSHCYAMQSNPFDKILNLAIFVVGSPPQGLKTSTQLVEVHFPAHARITYDITQRDHVIQQQIWVITGQLEIQLREQTYQLHQGDWSCPLC